jgi:hypothetical protein
MFPWYPLWVRVTFRKFLFFTSKDFYSQTPPPSPATKNGGTLTLTIEIRNNRTCIAEDGHKKQHFLFMSDRCPRQKYGCRHVVGTMKQNGPCAGFGPGWHMPSSGRFLTSWSTTVMQWTRQTSPLSVLAVLRWVARLVVTIGTTCFNAQ